MAAIDAGTKNGEPSMMTNGVTGSGTTAPGSDTKLPTDKLGADKATFLRLLVTQLKNQNPLSPSDGVEFVT